MSETATRRHRALPIVAGVFATALGAFIRMNARDFANESGIIDGKVEARWLEIGMWIVALGTVLIALSLYHWLSNARAREA